MLKSCSVTRFQVSTGRVPGKQLTVGQRRRHCMCASLHIALLDPNTLLLKAVN